MSANIILALSGLLLFILCLSVYISNPKKTVNKALTIFLFSGLVWVATNFLANISNTKESALLFSRATLIGGALSPLAFLIFVAAFTRFRKITQKYILAISILPAFILSFTFSGYNISSADLHGTHVTAGPVYILLFSEILIYITYGVYELLKFRKRASSLEKAQLQYIYVGVVLTIAPAVITNVLIPLFSTVNSSAYGPASVVAISFFTTVAIIRHRLLDVRLIVARSMTYVLVLGTLGVGFAAIILTLTSLFFPNASLSTGVKIVYVLSAVGIALIYQPLKRWFDRLTNRVFFRDYYDPQVVLDKLSALLVGTVDLKKIESGSHRILTETLRTSSVDYILLADQEEKKDEILHPLLQIRRDFITYDELDQHKYTALREAMAAREIALAARLKTTHGDLGFMVLGFKQTGSIYSDADTRLLGIVADEIAVGLQNALRFKEIQRFNETLQKKVEEATQQLRQANHRLKELDQTKDEFISMASHQLRTPLTTIKGYLSMVLEGDVGHVRNEEKKMIQQAFDSAERMVFLIGDLLNVSRLQSGKFVIDNKPTDLAKMIEAEVAQLQETANNHHLTLTYKKPEKFPLLNLDETKIRQVIMNFMDNAIFYTPAGGSIEVALEVTDGSINYTVKDTGLGVPKSEQHHLFAKFYRAGNARKMRPDGTGLGLFMAKKVIVAQGGAIIFNSEEGKGSTFGFSFPRSKIELKGKPAETPKAEAVAA